MIMTHAYLRAASVYACRDTVVNFSPGTWNRLEFKLLLRKRCCTEGVPAWNNYTFVSFSFR